MQPIDEAYQEHTVNLLSSTNVSGRVYGGHEEAGSLPKVNFYHIATVDLPGETLNGPNGLARVVMQTTAKAETKAELLEIMNLIMDDWKFKPNGANRRTIGNTYNVNIVKSNITTRQYVFDSELECWHGLCDVLLVYEEY